MKYIIALFLISVAVHADDYHVTNIANITNINTPKGIAIPGAMSLIDFDSNIRSDQIGFGAVTQDGENGFAVGYGKRVCYDQSCGLIKILGGASKGVKAAGVGLMFSL